MKTSQNILELIEKAFLGYLSGNIKADKLGKNLSVYVSDLVPGKKFTVAIVPSRVTPPAYNGFFGACVHPHTVLLEAITEEILKAKTSAELKRCMDKWKRLNNWSIDIESILFDQKMFKLTAKELTAILLHEVGHTFGADYQLRVFWLSYLSACSKLGIPIDSRHGETMSFMYTVPLMKYSLRWLQTRKYVKNSSKWEDEADTYVIEMGYGSDLESALSKIINIVSVAEKSATELDAWLETEILETTKWAMDPTRRRNELKDTLYYTTINSSNPKLKEMCVSVLNRLGHQFKENFTGNVVESALEVLSSRDFYKTYSGIWDLHKLNAVSAAAESTIKEAVDDLKEASRKLVPIPSIPKRSEIDTLFQMVVLADTIDDKTHALELIEEMYDRVIRIREMVELRQDLYRIYYPNIQAIIADVEHIRQAAIEKQVNNAEMQ